MTLTNESEVAAAMKGASGPLRVMGGGTRPIGRPLPGEVLSVAGLNGISLYEPGALTLVAQAGTPVADLEAALAAENQRLAFEPMDHRALLGTQGTPTIGGVVAANVSGPRRIAVGACRDFLLGVRFVDGAGQIVKNGGRVMKNVTGYDLVKLMCGAYGTLGVLTEVSLKVLPRAETQASLVVRDLTPAQSVAAMSAAFGSPFEVTGAAQDGSDTVIRIEGFRGSVAYRSGTLKDVLSAFGSVDVIDDAEASATKWRAIRDVSALHDADGDIWRISVRPSAAPGVIAALPNGSTHMMDWGGGLIWAAVPAGTDLRAHIGDTTGHMTLIRGTADVPTFHPEAAPLAAISAGLRAKFDPNGILNKGMMG
jgi:glycolate oxidase FAD binding subunit